LLSGLSLITDSESDLAAGPPPHDLFDQHTVEFQFDHLPGLEQFLCILRQGFLRQDSQAGISDISSSLSFIKSYAVRVSEKDEFPLWSDLSR
jgi:hypothetical protein